MDDRTKEIRAKIKSSKWAKAFEEGRKADDEAAEKAKAAKATEPKKVAKAKVAQTEPKPASKREKGSPTNARAGRANYGKNAGVVAAQQLQDAFDFFNAKLFSNRLPVALVRYQVEKKAAGIFTPDRFARVRGEDRLDEICVNPTMVDGRTDKDILSTLVHEMVHLEQETFGKAPRKCYHNEQWMEMMEAVGLEGIIVDAKGNPTGKPKGKLATHKIDDGGKFDRACDELLESGFALQWLRLPDPIKIKKEGKKKPKTKGAHICPDCDEKATGKIEARFICGACNVPMDPPEPEKPKEDE